MPPSEPYHSSPGTLALTGLAGHIGPAAPLCGALQALQTAPLTFKKASLALQHTMGLGRPTDAQLMLRLIEIFTYTSYIKCRGISFCAYASYIKCTGIRFCAYAHS